MLTGILLSTALIFCQWHVVLGQLNKSDKNPLVIGIKSHYGKILIHSQEVREIKDSYPFGLELDISRHKNKQKDWDNCRCYPRVGVALNYFNYDNPEVLGDGVAAVYYVEPFFGTHRKLSFSTRAGAGISYLTNPYHKDSNPKNQSYSTHINAFLLIEASLNYQISKHLGFNASAGFNHLSNGGIQNPNKGINFPTFGFGLDYTLNPQKWINRKSIKSINDGVRKEWLEMDLMGIFKSYRHEEAPEHLIWGGAVNYTHQIGRINALNAGAEWMVNGIVKEDMERKGISGKSHARAGILLGHTLLMGKYHFSTQIGGYVYRPYRDNNNDLMYQRYKLRYRFDNGLYFGVSLKAHRHVADYFDLRIGYSIQRLKH